MSSSVASASDLRWYQGIDRKLWIILAVTYVGWLLDSMDLNLFTVVLVPSLRELLGPQASPQTIGYYGGVIAAVQLLGWGVGGLIFGILGDYWGRSRTLCISIVVYALFTALSGFAATWWQLAIFRFLMAAGVGAEWAIGTALINETWPQRSRVAASGVMMSAFGFGYLLAGIINLAVGSYGWRWVFFTGVIPAILIAFVWHEVPESERWQNAARRRNDAQQRLRSGGAASQEDKKLTEFTFLGLFQPPWLRNTVAATIMSFAATVGFWGTQTWIPARAAELAVAGGASPVQIISIAIIILNCAAVVGLLMFAWLTELIGRRPAFALGCIGNMIVLPIVFLVPQNYQTLFMLLPLMGLFTNGILGTFTPYFPELFPTRLRATGVGFCFNIARIFASVGPFIAGSLVVAFGGIPKSGAIMALSYAIGLIAVYFAPETRGKPLPE
ncbi:MFS transporter [Bradyrhizobium canariense]|uniref:Predicted arabinose efflux permease, MFS family n=1 Tax=Bradyrhizobium canariense TaxID=255045 RepID=A0A1H1NIN5_9BRAD|nr:MFS transporter [Bradyrhizobium canariense]SDR98595.1 Predicted arabinose efflux permease, MFS family [Bradyrhizobium canariense]